MAKAKAKAAKPERPKPTPPKQKSRQPPAPRVPPNAAVAELAAAIAAAPDERELQTIYADALIEQGGEHAIRGELVTLALSDRHPKMTEPRRIKLANQLEQILRDDDLDQRVIGGFVGAWTCKSDELVARGTEVFAAEPLLRELQIELTHANAAAQIDAIAAMPELARVRRLAIVGHQTRTGRPEARGITNLFASPHWPELEALRLPNCAIGDAGAKLIAHSRTMRQLRELDLTQNDIFSGGVIELAKSPHLTELRQLTLESNKPGQRGVRAIAETRHLKKLEYINLKLTWLAANETAPIIERFGRDALDRS